MRTRLLLLAAGAVLCASGCGTLANLSERHRVPGDPPKCKPFGGVREDIECVTNIEGQSGENLFAFFGLIDLPLSLVGDVFTLPWTIRATRLRKMWPAEPIESISP